MLRSEIALLGFALLVCVPTRTARAEDHVEAARVAFKRGNELAKDERWAEALAAFEESADSRAHVQTFYNIGLCERVLGRATRARMRFLQALERGTQASSELPASMAEEMRGYVDEYDRTLPRVIVTLLPKDARIAVDGRPLVVRPATKEDARPVLVAGLATPGIGEPPPAAEFDLVVDSGTRILTLTHAGFRDIVIKRRFETGERAPLRLELDRLPAQIKVDANVSEAIVKVNGVDIGFSPIAVPRPAGMYHVTVTRSGYVPFVNDVTMQAGQETTLRANLVEEKVPLTKRWWFWTGAVGVVAASAAIVYAATRPTPQPPPYDGGSTGWIVSPGR